MEKENPMFSRGEMRDARLSNRRVYILARYKEIYIWIVFNMDKKIIYISETAKCEINKDKIILEDLDKTFISIKAAIKANTFLIPKFTSAYFNCWKKEIL